MSEPTLDLNRMQTEAIVFALRYYAHCLISSHPPDQVPEAVSEAARYRWELAETIESSAVYPEEVVQ